MDHEKGSDMSVERLESRLPADLQARLSGFRRRLWRVKTLEGVFAALLGLAVSYLAVFGLDRAFDTPAWLRGLLLLGGVAGFVLFLPAKLHRWVIRCRSLVQVSRVLVRVNPDAGDRLLGIVELAEDEREHRASPQLVEAAIAQVAEDTRELDLQQCVPDPRHKGWGLGAAAAMLIAVGALVVPGAGSNAFLRWAFPWMDTPRYTFAQLDGVPDRVVAALGEPFEVRLVLDEDSAWRPESALARYEDQNEVRAERIDDAYVFRFPGQTKAGRVAVEVGDARESFPVEPLPRPELIALDAQVVLPDYLQHPPREADVRGGLVHAVEGSQVTLQATVSRALAEASMGGAPLEIEGDRLRLPEFSIDDPTERELRWTDVEGLQAREPFLVRVQSVPDETPTIGVRELEFEQVVLESDVLSFKVSANDDYGIQEVGIEWAGAVPASKGELAVEPPRGEYVLAKGDPLQNSLDVDGVFCATRLGIDPQPLELRAYTLDYRPGAERVYSAVYRVFVLSMDQHMMYVTERLGEWQESVLEVRDQEQRLYDRNRELRDLSPEELDSDPARQEIARQAEAERANGRRLDALTDIGRELIDEAIRNPQFNTQTLENWAAMLEALEGLASENMPSVAELLAQAAAAPSQGPKPGESDLAMEPGPSAEPGESSPSEDGEEPEDGEGMPAVGNMVQNSGGSEGPDSPPPSVPQVVDMENGADRDPEMPVVEGESPPPPPPSEGGGKLGLASTSVVSSAADAAGDGDAPPPPPPAETPAQEELDAALAEQAALLAEFNEVMDKIGEILRDLQGSTFVKRLKAVAKAERNVASTLHGRIQWTFGEEPTKLAEHDQGVLERTARSQVGTSQDVRLIQEDLIAYFDRVQQPRFERVHGEMDESEVAKSIEDSSDVILANLTGEAVAEAEFWTDEFDRWAEMLVGPG